ncbi:MAG: hypothetical protein ACYCSB_03905 [bacterium]
MSKQILNCYMAYEKDSCKDGACLVFAHTAKKAKKIAYKEILTIWYDDILFIDARAKRIKNTDHLYSQGDPDKLKAGIPHIVDNPITCSKCGLWWDYPLTKDGYCESCQENFKEYKKNAGI